MSSEQAMTKGDLRRLRKAARAAGRPWSVEAGESGPEIVYERTPAEERRHERAMERWARRTNGGEYDYE